MALQLVDDEGSVQNSTTVDSETVKVRGNKEFELKQEPMMQSTMDKGNWNSSTLRRDKGNTLESVATQSKIENGSSINGFIGKQLEMSNENMNIKDIYDLDLKTQLEITQRVLMLHGRYYYEDNVSTYPIYDIKESFDGKQHFQSATHTIKHETYILNNKFSKHVINSNLESLMHDNTFKLLGQGVTMGFDLSRLNKNENENNIHNREETTVEYVVKGQILLNKKCLNFTKEFIQSIEKLIDENNEYYTWNDIVSEFGEYFVQQAWIGQKTWVSHIFTGNIRQNFTNKDTDATLNASSDIEPEPIMNIKNNQSYQNANTNKMKSNDFKTQESSVFNQIGNAKNSKEWKIIRILKIISLRDIIIKQYLVNCEKYQNNKEKLNAVIKNLISSYESYLLQRRKKALQRFSENPNTANDTFMNNENENKNDTMQMDVINDNSWFFAKFKRIEQNCEYYIYTEIKNERIYIHVDSSDYLHVKSGKEASGDIKLKFEFIPYKHAYNNCTIRTSCNKFVDTWNGYLDQDKQARKFRIEYFDMPQIIAPRNKKNNKTKKNKNDQIIPIVLKMYYDKYFYCINCDETGWIKMSYKSNVVPTVWYLEKCPC